jgi:hypothetical protein
MSAKRPKFAQLHNDRKSHVTIGQVAGNVAGAASRVVTHIRRFIIGMSTWCQMPGVIAVAQSTLAREAIEDLVIILRCSMVEEWRDQVSYLPLR